MAEALTAAGGVLQAATGAAGMAQGAHENAVQYRQDALTGAQARTQNERLLNGPGAFPGYTENVQGYTSPGYSMYGSTPQFTDGAPQQGGSVPGNTQVSAMPVGQPVMMNPNAPMQSMMTAAGPQQGYDVGSAMGLQPMYIQPQAPANVFGIPYFFTDTQGR